MTPIPVVHRADFSREETSACVPDAQARRPPRRSFGGQGVDCARAVADTCSEVPDGRQTAYALGLLARFLDPP